MLTIFLCKFIKNFSTCICTTYVVCMTVCILNNFVVPSYRSWTFRKFDCNCFQNWLFYLASNDQNVSRIPATSCQLPSISPFFNTLFILTQLRSSVDAPNWTNRAEQLWETNWELRLAVPEVCFDQSVSEFFVILINLIFSWYLIAIRIVKILRFLLFQKDIIDLTECICKTWV